MMNIKVKFSYYWEPDDEKPFPDYRVVKSRNPDIPMDSHISRKTCLKHGIEIPATPTYEEWKKQTQNKKRCYRCWKITRTFDDYNRHIYYKHQL